MASLGRIRNLLGLQAAVAAHEDVDVLVIALGAREQLEPHRRDLVEDPARGDRVVLREVGPEFQILVELPQGPSGGAVVDRLMNTDVPAPPPPEHQFLPEEKFLPPPPKE